MTPEQALNILNEAASLAPLNRQGHQTVVQATQVLNNVIKPKAKSKKAK